MWCRVLLVDDDGGVLGALRRELMRKPDIGHDGLEIEAFVNPREALERIRQPDAQFDIAIVDYRMPAMDGISFLRELHRIRPETIRILLTGLADADGAILAINEAQVDFLLTKPWSEYDLKGRIALALHQRELAREARSTSPRPGLPGPPYRLMLVDDEASVLSALEREIALAGSGSKGGLFRIGKYTSPGAALRAAGEACPDLVIADYRMPEMDGVTFFHKLRETCPEAVRIMLSGQEGVQMLIDAINIANVYHFLFKPWDAVNLRATISQALRYRLVGFSGREQAGKQV